MVWMPSCNPSGGRAAEGRVHLTGLGSIWMSGIHSSWTASCTEICLAAHSYEKQPVEGHL